MRGPALGVVRLSAGRGRISFATIADGNGNGGALVGGFLHLIAYADQTSALHSGRVYCWDSKGNG